MSDLDAVCSDLDGTLCVSDQDSAALLELAFERAGTDAFFSVSDAVAIDLSTLPPADSDVEFHEHLFSAAAAEAGTDSSTATVTAVAAARVDALDPSEVSFRDRAQAALECARERNDLALVTNGGREARGKAGDPRYHRQLRRRGVL